MTSERIVLLTSDCDFGRLAASRLAAMFPALTVIVEAPISRFTLLKGRLRRLGVVQTAGQLAFMLLQRLQQRVARGRIAEIMETARLKAEWPGGGALVRVPSVNSSECIAQLQQLRPQAILVVGTRLIERPVLAAVNIPLINYHAGITPKYRGVHGGYWAKAEDDLGNFGVTVHLVDAGIDTGAVLYQARVTPTPRDNFSTYPYLQMAAALPLLEQAARDAVAGTLKPQAVDLPSRAWSHPTLWCYLATGVRRGVW
jgi:methionyl-tRNA formyltransferase